MLGRLLFIVVLIVALVPSVARAAAEVTFEAELLGWSGEADPFIVRVIARSDVLWSGHLEFNAGEVTVFEPVEIPAGTEKQWDVTVPGMPGADRVSVNLVGDDGQDQDRVLVQLPADGGRPRVAALGVSVETLAVIGDARSSPLGNVPIMTNLLAGDLDSLSGHDYAVLESVPGSELLADLVAWVESGGRVIGEPAITAAFPAGAGGEWGGIGVASLGRGEVVTIPVELWDSPAAWGLALRDIGEVDVVIGEGQFEGPYRSLGTAAAGSGDALALIPWLLEAMGVYVVVAGPANIIVLRRLGRPELGWVTIPVLALVGVVGLWYFGPRQSTVIARHATVITDDFEVAGVSLVASNDGERNISLLDGGVIGVVDSGAVEVHPASDGLDVGLETGRSITVVGSKPHGGGVLTVVRSGDVLTVTNGTGVVMERWGVALGSAVVGSSADLAPGESYGIGAPGWVVENMWEPLLMQSLWEDPELGRDDLAWRVYQPLMAAGEQLVEGVRTESFAWGLSSQERQGITIDGRMEMVEGHTLYLFPIDVAPDQSRGTQGRVLGLEGLLREGPTFLWGRGSVVLEFAVDPTTARMRLQDQFGGFGRNLAYSVFDPVNRDWELVGEPGTAFDGGGRVTPSGWLYIRIETTDEGEIDLQGLVVEAAP